MNVLLKHLEGVIAMDWPTIAVICVLCALACYFLREYLANPPMIIFVYPVLVGLSMVVQYLFILGDFYAPKKLDQWLTWTIFATICGTVVGTALVAAVAAKRDSVGSRKA